MTSKDEECPYEVPPFAGYEVVADTASNLWLCFCFAPYGDHSPRCPAYDPKLHGRIVRMGDLAKPDTWIPNTRAEQDPRRPGIGAVVAMVAAAAVEHRLWRRYKKWEPYR
jgi:hypothetical protein